MQKSLQPDSVRSALAYSAFAAALFFIMTVVAFGETLDLAHPAKLCSLAEPRRLG